MNKRAYALLFFRAKNTYPLMRKYTYLRRTINMKILGALILTIVYLACLPVFTLVFLIGGFKLALLELVALGIYVALMALILKK